MNTTPEHDPLSPQDSAPQAETPAPLEVACGNALIPSADSTPSPKPSLTPEEILSAALGYFPSNFQDPARPEQGDPVEPRLFESFTQPVTLPPPSRTPHFGHLLLLGALTLVSLVAVGLITRSALHFHLFGITNLNQAVTDIHYTLGTMGALYLFTFLFGALIFPLLWQKNLFDGLQWRAATAMHLRRRLISAAVVCFVLALINGVLMPGPPDTPIDKIFRAPGAAWLMFFFGITFAPFFEEIIFRGFLLPSLCTAYDWAAERVSHQPSRGSDENGHPLWSIPAMLTGSLLTSIPFALMHAQQTGWAIGPLLLLVCVSLVLCWARLSTRSLAASVLVHACYNFLLFSIMLIGTSGFRHLDKM